MGPVHDMTLETPQQTARRRGAQACHSQGVAARPAPAQTPPAPPRYKLAVLTWIGAYGVITLILGVLGDAIASWPLLLRTLLVSVLMVGALTWVVTPTMTRMFRRWLQAGPGRPIR
jgi:antibiotic biosynthesis monooxygenase (ABM) superfamily enzyme